MNQVISFSVLFSFWLIWSGKFDLFHLALGVISSYIVTKWSGDLLVEGSGLGIGKRLKIFIRYEIYSIWLLYEILLANIHVIYVAMHPEMKNIINSQMIEFKTKLKTDFAKYILAQSITLTPGTVTVRINNNKVLVHALTSQTADGVPGIMEDKVSAVFEEK